MSNYHKEIIIEKDDCKYKIYITISDGTYYDPDYHYRINFIEYLPKRKRKWLRLTDEWRDSLEYRKARREGKREEWALNKLLEYFTEEEITTAMNTLYEEVIRDLKPDIKNNLVVNI
jgi:hypothetical protein